MTRSLRLSEKWFNRGLWVIALVFAGFLIGLGNVIVGDLPQVDGRIVLEDFVDQSGVAPLRAERDSAIARADAAKAPLDQAELQYQATSQAYPSGRETFQNWVTTRTVTNRSGEDIELLARTARLDTLKSAEDGARIAAEAQRQVMLDARQAQARADARLQPLMAAAQMQFEAALRASELRVFGYRLALTLPLLVIAG